ncbi:hypothetical protein BUALT_Bualt15G0051600 [Buddleja alternifolia]|uniref:Uncharacterized protein n=1 Tax=Buddleja alternifolia TaxID=168488 RepID=A0AAV6WI21_9LAMI|nr:hypothetical protein BUALT_Bualt15G0051600 [Buddleja alternifolia]
MSKRILTRVRDFYKNTLCDCNQGSVINCTVTSQKTQLSKKDDVGSSKEIDDEDLRDLMRLLSSRKGGGAKVDVDSEGNLVWRKPSREAVVEGSYSGGVGKMGRIDEDKPCVFNEVDLNTKSCYLRPYGFAHAWMMIGVSDGLIRLQSSLMSTDNLLNSPKTHIGFSGIAQRLLAIGAVHISLMGSGRLLGMRKEARTNPLKKDQGYIY